MDNVTAVTKSSEASGTNAPAGEKPAKKIEVDDLLITGAKVHVSIGGSEMTLPLPDIHLTDLGKGEGGLTPADLTKRVLSAITTSTLKAVVSGSTNIGKGIQNLGKNAGETAGKVGDKITKGIGGLFKK